jgi:hypothetical protein
MPIRRPALAPVADDNASVVLPFVAADSFASLTPRTIEVDLADRTWTIPAMNAEQWLELLWTEPFDPDSIFPGLVEQDDVDDVLIDAILDGTLDPGADTDVAMEVLETASGFRWWFTLRLVGVFKASWSRLGGSVILAGLRHDQLSLGAWLAGALQLCIDHMEPRKAAELLTELSAVPEGFGLDQDEPNLTDEMAFMEAMRTSF